MDFMQLIEWFLELHQLHARKYKWRPPRLGFTQRAEHGTNVLSER